MYLNIFVEVSVTVYVLSTVRSLNAISFIQSGIGCWVRNTAPLILGSVEKPQGRSIQIKDIACFSQPVFSNGDSAVYHVM